MARAGEKLYNPIQGDWMVFRETARDSGGKLLSAELIVSPHGSNPLHVHPHQEEHFEVLSGTLGIQVGDEYGTCEGTKTTTRSTAAESSGYRRSRSDVFDAGDCQGGTPSYFAANGILVLAGPYAGPDQ
jgi:hypothetical protein